MEILFALLADGLFPLPTTLGRRGIAYQSVEVDSLINPPLLKEGGEMFSFDSLRIHIGSIYDTDAPRTSHISVSQCQWQECTDHEDNHFVWMYSSSVQFGNTCSGNGKYGYIGV